MNREEDVPTRAEIDALRKGQMRVINRGLLKAEYPHLDMESIDAILSDIPSYLERDKKDKRIVRYV